MLLIFKCFFQTQFMCIASPDIICLVSPTYDNAQTPSGLVICLCVYDRVLPISLMLEQPNAWLQTSPPPCLPTVWCALFQPIFPCGKAPLPRLHSFPIKPTSSDSNYSNYSSQGCEWVSEWEGERERQRLEHGEPSHLRELECKCSQEASGSLQQ